MRQKLYTLLYGIYLLIRNVVYLPIRYYYKYYSFYRRLFHRIIVKSIWLVKVLSDVGIYRQQQAVRNVELDIFIVQHYASNCQGIVNRFRSYSIIEFTRIIMEISIV